MPRPSTGPQPGGSETLHYTGHPMWCATPPTRQHIIICLILNCHSDPALGWSYSKAIPIFLDTSALSLADKRNELFALYIQ